MGAADSKALRRRHDLDVSATYPRAIKSQAILLAATMGRLVLSILITALLGRWLAEDEYGFFALVATTMLVAHELLDLGTASVAAREIAAEPGREQSLLEALLGWRRLWGIVIGLIILPFAAVVESDRRWVVIGLASAMPLLAPTALYPAFQVRQAQLAPALLAVASQALLLIGAVLMWVMHAGGILFAWLIVAREVFAAVGLRLASVRLLGRWLRGALGDRGLLRFLSAALLYGGAALMHKLYFHCDVFLVRAMRGEAELGAYAAAFRPVQPLLVLPWMLMVPLVPLLAAAAIKDRPRFARQVEAVSLLGLGFGLIGAVVGVLLAGDLIGVLYGGRYLRGDLSAVDALRWLSVAGALCYVTPALATSLMADRQERVLLSAAAVGLIVNLSGNLALIPVFGFTAAAVTTAATELLVVLVIAVSAARSTRSHGAAGGLPASAPGRRPGKPGLPGARGARTVATVCVGPAVVGLLIVLVPGGRAVSVAVGLAGGLLAAGVLLRSPAARSLKRDLADVADQGYGSALSRADVTPI